MLIKKADGRAQDIEILQALLTHPDATLVTRKKITQEIKNIHIGEKNEKSAQYQIDFRFKGRKDWAVIHDLRLEHDGLCAQIDHLLINRFLEIWLCESKYWANGIAINEQGEFTSFYGNSPRGIPSPLEQNGRHILLIKNMINNKVIDVPKKLGMPFKPIFKSLVLVSPNARITRPATQVVGVETIIKADQFNGYFDKRMTEAISPIMALKYVSKMINCHALEVFGTQVAALHKPKQFDWHAKFGLSKPEPDPLCPKCGESMVARTAKRGKNEGKQFWGCSKFPKCWGRKEISENLVRT